MNVLIVVASSAALVLLVVAAVVLRENRTLRTRLAFAFVALALAPTLLSLATLVIGVQQPQMAVSPGILASVENTLVLARHVIGEHHGVARAAAQVALERLRAADTVPEDGLTDLLETRYEALYCAGAPGEETLRAHYGAWTAAQAATLVQDVLPGERAGSGVPQLLSAPNGTSIVVGVAGPLEKSGEPFYAMVAVTVDPDAARAIDEVRRSYQRLQQLRLWQERIRNSVLAFVALAIVFLGFALALSFMLSHRLTRPIGDLQRAFAAVAAGELGTQVPGRAGGEMGRLTQGFNRMSADLQRSHEQLVRATRLAAWQDVARRLAHEIKNPLTPITLSIHRLRKRLDGEDAVVRECLDTVLEETSHLKRLADEFSSFARLPKPRLEPLDAAETLQQVLELYSALPQVRLQATLADTPMVLADRDQLRQVFTNVVKNAVEAMPHGGQIDVGWERDGAFVVFTFLDQGCGFPLEVGSRVFEPTFTTKATGSGLGLAIVRRILEDHGGDIQAGNRDGGGAWVRIRLRIAA